MTLDLSLARTPQVSAVDCGGRERIAAQDGDMCADDLAVLEREGIERAMELVRWKDERCRQPMTPPRAPGIRTRREIGSRQRCDECEAMDGIVAAAIIRVRSVDDEGFEPLAEDALKIGDERVDRTAPGRRHRGILSSLVSGLGSRVFGL